MSKAMKHRSQIIFPPTHVGSRTGDRAGYVSIRIGATGS
jgi:hypothetical protein